MLDMNAFFVVEIYKRLLLKPGMTFDLMSSRDDVGGR